MFDYQNQGERRRRRAGDPPFDDAVGAAVGPARAIETGPSLCRPGAGRQAHA